MVSKLQTCNRIRTPDLYFWIGGNHGISCFLAFFDIAAGEDQETGLIFGNTLREHNADAGGGDACDQNDFIFDADVEMSEEFVGSSVSIPFALPATVTDVKTSIWGLL